MQDCNRKCVGIECGVDTTVVQELLYMVGRTPQKEYTYFDDEDDFSSLHPLTGESIYD